MTLDSLKRLFISLRLNSTSNAFWRADYLRRKGVMGHMGRDVVWQVRYLPYRSDLIFVGDNVTVATGVLFLTHDAMHRVFHNTDGATYPEFLGAVHIGNNCFIGARSILVGPVTVGNNCVIAAGSLVNRDVPEGSVVGGVPARVIGRFDDLKTRRRAPEVADSD